MFVERLISGIVLVVLAIASIYCGGTVLLGVVMALSLIGQFELYRVIGMEKKVLGYIGYFATLCYGAVLFFEKQSYIQLYLLGALLIFMVCYVLCYPQYTFKDVAMTFVGVIYIPMMLSCMYQVRCMDYGLYLVWMIFISAWGSDTCAYCVGKLIGKHKLPTPLSPKKTIEGCLGGIVGAAVIAFVYATIFKEVLQTAQYSVWMFLVVGAVGAVCSQIGDLAASAIKRNYEIKDYGHLIPGHGGVMDRFDSILFTAPLVYLFLSLV